jgi:hypothetical protein
LLPSHRHVVDVAPSPVLARLEGLDNWMAGLLVMGGRVTVGRRVAASDVPASQAEPQVYPAVPRRKALGTSLRSERVDRLQTDDVFACGGHVSRDYVPPSHAAFPTPWPGPPRRSSGRPWHEPRLPWQRLSRMPFRVNPDLSTIKDAPSGSCDGCLGRFRARRATTRARVHRAQGTVSQVGFPLHGGGADAEAHFFSDGDVATTSPPASNAK